MPCKKIIYSSVPYLFISFLTYLLIHLDLFHDAVFHMLLEFYREDLRLCCCVDVFSENNQLTKILLVKNITLLSLLCKHLTSHNADTLKF